MESFNIAGNKNYNRTEIDKKKTKYVIVIFSSWSSLVFAATVGTKSVRTLVKKLFICIFWYIYIYNIYI